VYVIYFENNLPCVRFTLMKFIFSGQVSAGLAVFLKQGVRKIQPKKLS